MVARVGRVWTSHLKHQGEDYVVFSHPLVRPPSFAELTRAELEVVEGVLAGHAMPVLARRREVSQRTVANQLARAYRKLGVASRHELAAMVSQPGTVGLE
jgi:DNA-binding NarL/FixJ family response regulator